MKVSHLLAVVQAISAWLLGKYFERWRKMTFGGMKSKWIYFSVGFKDAKINQK